ncbi:MAG: menaquinone-dependent protoporphyrinogen IX dehydrogenase, partial [Gallionella sp.]
TDGHTLKICQRLRQQMRSTQSHDVTLRSLDEGSAPDLTIFDALVIGASIRYGKHKQCVYDFIQRNQPYLNSIPNAFFSVNVVARKPDKADPDTNPYVRKFLKQVSWQPKILAVFAGKIDYKKYRFWDKQMIRLIMWMTNGPTDLDKEVEFTDWDKVDDFGRLVGGMQELL